MDKELERKVALIEKFKAEYELIQSKYPKILDGISLADYLKFSQQDLELRKLQEIKEQPV